jgi:hypothetical protein
VDATEVHDRPDAPLRGWIVIPYWHASSGMHLSVHFQFANYEYRGPNCVLGFGDDSTFV